MEKSTKEALPILRRKTSRDLSSVTFSAASVAGLTHSGWLIGQKTERSGREAALASHSVSPEKAAELMMLVTCGRLFVGSLPNDGLQQSLENKLRQRLDVNGSPEYVLTWKQWDMQSGVPICALRASVRRTSGNGCGGWPTPNRGDADRGRRQKDGKRGTLMIEAVRGWATPKVARGGYCYSRGNHNKPILTLAGQAQLAGWQTPKQPSGGGQSKRLTAGGGLRKLEDQIIGVIPDSSNVPTENKDGYRLNALFSLWLMGFPVEWGYSGARAMQSYRKSRRSS
jgi:hypothetical protein